MMKLDNLTDFSGLRSGMSTLSAFLSASGRNVIPVNCDGKGISPRMVPNLWQRERRPHAAATAA